MTHNLWVISHIGQYKPTSLKSFRHKLWLISHYSKWKRTFRTVWFKGHATYAVIQTSILWLIEIQKINLKFKQGSSLNWGWSIIRFWTYRWARISSELFFLVMWLSHKFSTICHVIPTGWINMWLQTPICQNICFWMTQL